MRNTEERKTGTAVFLAIGAAAVLWLSLLLAPCLGGGLPQMIPKLGDALSHPFRLSFCRASFPTALILLAVYGLVILICHYTIKRTFICNTSSGCIFCFSPSHPNKHG